MLVWSLHSRHPTTHPRYFEFCEFRVGLSVNPIRVNSLDLWSEFAMSFFLWRHLA